MFETGKTAQVSKEMERHLQAKEKEEDPKPPGERQLTLNLLRWVCKGKRHRQLQKTRPSGKETLLQ